MHLLRRLKSALGRGCSSRKQTTKTYFNRGNKEFRVLASLEETEALQVVVRFEQFRVVGRFVEQAYRVYFDHSKELT